MARCQPDPHTSRDRDHRRPSTQLRMRPSASVSMSLYTRKRRPLPRSMVTSLRFRWGCDEAGASEAAGWAAAAASKTIKGIRVLAVSDLGSSTWQSPLRHRKSWLTWMLAARAISENRTRLKAGCNQPLFVIARPAPTALDRRDHFNLMLRHRTTPSVCTRRSDVRINLARRPSPGTYLHPARQVSAERLCRSLQPNCPASMARSVYFDSITEVQEIATEWLRTYNHERSNMGIGGITPAQKLKMAA